MLFLLLLAITFGQAPAQTSALQRGLRALRDGNLAEAKSSFETAVQKDPKNAFAWVSLAETCRRMGDSTTASDAAQRAESFGSNIPVVDHALAAFYSELGQFSKSASFEERYANSPKADAAAGLRTAELYERAGDQASVERVLKSTWQRQSSDSLVAFRYAQFLLRKLDFAAAASAVAPALATHPKDPQLILVLGVAHYGQRQFSSAIDDFLKVISIDPAIPQPYEFIGKMMEQVGPKLPEVTKAFETRVESAPNDALANLVLAKAKIAADAKDPEAEALVRHALSIDPKQWEAHFELGVILESKHDFKAAADELRQSIALDPTQAVTHYHLARVYDRLGETELAQAERKRNEELSGSKK